MMIMAHIKPTSKQIQPNTPPSTFLAGKQVCIIDYWNGTSAVSPKITAFTDQVAKKVHSNFFTVNIARTADDKLIVMEIGDGQVSGLQGFSEMEFYRKLFDVIDFLKYTE